MFIVVVLAIPILIIGLVVYAVRHFTGRDAVGDADGRGVRRFFQYLLLYGLMIVAAVGLAGLLARLLDRPSLVSEGGGPALARAVTFSVIGVPLFLAVAAWSRRRLIDDPDEARSLGWNFYATAAPITALVAAMYALHGVASWVLTNERYDGDALARLVVWGGVWLAHWLFARRFTDGNRSQLHLALGSLIGLGTAATGLISLLAAALEALVGPGGGLVVGQRNEIAAAGATLVTGAPVWAVYWLARFARSPRSPLWFGYVLPLGVGGGLVTAIAAGSTVLYDTLVWFFGDPFSVEARRHFENAPAAIAAVVVGLLVWWYHREILDQAKTAERTEVGRVYEYLIAGIGLLAAAGGMTTVLVALIEAITGPGQVEVGTAAINTLLAAVTLLVVGGPLWWIFWRRIQRAVDADSEVEVPSPTRRIYLFVLFGLGGVAAVIALLVGVFIAVEDLLEGGFGSETIRSMRFALGLLATTGAIAAYHWAVYRQDRTAVPEQARRHLRHVVLVGPADDEIVRQVAAATGARVELWERTDGAASTWSIDALTAALAGTEGDEVMVMAGTSGIEVIGIRRD